MNANLPSKSDPSALAFIKDLKGSLARRIQLTSDGLRSYLVAVGQYFGADIDYAVLQKIYGPAPQGERRYSPGTCIGAKKETMLGNPDPAHFSTSFVERQNLTMRMHMRRFTWLTNASSKKIDNHVSAVALHCMFYNFVRIHQTLKMTPAMAAGVTKRLWEMTDVVDMIDAWEAKRVREIRLAA